MTTWPESTSPISLELATAVGEGIVVRQHACGTPYADYTNMKYLKIPAQGTSFSFDFVQMCQRVIISMIPNFVNLEYDYASNDWYDFPKMLTAHDVFSNEDRNILLMPSRSSYALNYTDWFQRAKNCLDLMVATLESSSGEDGLRCLFSVSGFSFSSTESMSTVITNALSNAESNRITYPTASRPMITPKYAGREWDIGRWGYDGSDPYNHVDTDQWGEIKLKHISPMSAIPVIVAKPIGDPTEELFGHLRYVFDPVGSGWTLGATPLEPLTSYESREVDMDDSIYPPDVVPTLEVPDLPEYNGFVNDVFLGYKLTYYLDWRTEGGFKYYTKEVEDEEE